MKVTKRFVAGVSLAAALVLTSSGIASAHSSFYFGFSVPVPPVPVPPVYAVPAPPQPPYYYPGYAYPRYYYPYQRYYYPYPPRYYRPYYRGDYWRHHEDRDDWRR